MSFAFSRKEKDITYCEQIIEQYRIYEILGMSAVKHKNLRYRRKDQCLNTVMLNQISRTKNDPRQAPRKNNGYKPIASAVDRK